MLRCCFIELSSCCSVSLSWRSWAKVLSKLDALRFSRSIWLISSLSPYRRIRLWVRTSKIWRRGVNCILCSEQPSPKGSTGSNDRRHCGAGVDRRRTFRLGVRSPDPATPVNDVRCMAGVRPVEKSPASCSRGPGSENRTRFLDFLGVAEVVGAVYSELEPEPFLVRSETGEPTLESHTELFFLFLADCRVSIMRWYEEGAYSVRILGRLKTKRSQMTSGRYVGRNE